MVRGDVLDELQRDLNWLKRQYEKKYGLAVWDVRCWKSPSGTDVYASGYVSLPAQERVAERMVARHLGGRVRYNFGVAVVADPAATFATGWGWPKVDVLDVYSRPLTDASLELLRDRFLSTQVPAAPRPVRALFLHKGWLLVQLDDLTLGWTRKNLVEVANTSVRARSAPGVRSGKSPTSRGASAAVVEKAKELVGVPYLWGGVTKIGIDCSGLAQRVYRDAAGIILPKHSRDQLAAGRGVSFKRREAGDLIFFNREGSRELHVGLLQQRERVFHASARRGAVVLEALSTISSSSDIVGVRRIVGAHGSKMTAASPRTSTHE